MGYDDVQTTINIYGHLFPAEESRNADLLDAAYRAEEPKVAALASVGEES